MPIDQTAVAALEDRVIGPEHKGMPPTSWGRTVREFLATAPTLDQLETPVLTVDRAAVATNIAVMADWVRAAGVRLAPHGKTTMAPQLWADQLAAGSWGITLATIWQTQVARSFGVARILLANALVDPVGLHWLATELANDPGFEFACWADSVETVALMDEHLRTAPGSERVRVLVELGGPRGRTGARTVEQAHAVARAIDRASRLTLAGVGGYEGALAHYRTPNGIRARLSRGTRPPASRTRRWRAVSGVGDHHRGRQCLSGAGGRIPRPARRRAGHTWRRDHGSPALRGVRHP
ncbi:hypothetical protein [Nocardia amamiensis]|uniref:hypothetical protein n=1 Tax=Nocardia amamiensis TaxID=404578 RepID=UPI002B4B4C62|nr:hypothetical protein [Nocardia amamiensis]